MAGPLEGQAVNKNAMPKQELFCSLVLLVYFIFFTSGRLGESGEPNGVKEGPDAQRQGRSESEGTCLQIYVIS